MIYKAKSLVNKRGKRKNAIYRKRKNKRKEGKKGSNEEKLSVKFIKIVQLEKRKEVEEEKDKSDTEFFNSSVY